jgi:hypothetical protein
MYTIDTTEAVPRFEFEIDGDRYSVELYDRMDVTDAEAIAKRVAAAGDARAQVNEWAEVIRELFDRDAHGAVERLNVKQWRGLAMAYMDACGLTAGE